MKHWLESIKVGKIMNKSEQIFKGEVDVTYLFKKSYRKTNGLVIIFSAFPSKGQPPMYNYIRTLSGIDCNKLFILDRFGDDDYASYYLCENREFAIERSVIALINTLVKENDIKHIISGGSSKGGAASLYYGIKYGFDNIVVASPQYLLGNFLLKEDKGRQDSAIFMAGGNDRRSRKYLNAIIPSTIEETPHKPHIFIHLGRYEAHYKDHVKPLIKKLDKAQMKYTLDLGEYSRHNDVMKYFPKLFHDHVRDILNYPHISIQQSIIGECSLGAECTFTAQTDAASNKIAWYLYHNDNKVASTEYTTTDKDYTVRLESKGQYYVKAFCMNNDKLQSSATSESIMVNVARV